MSQFLNFALLFVIQKLCEASKKLEKALGDVNERDISGQRTAEQLKKSKAEIGDLKNSFETVSDELQRVKIEVGISTTKIGCA